MPKYSTCGQGGGSGYISATRRKIATNTARLYFGVLPKDNHVRPFLSIRFPEKKFPCLEKKCPNLGSLLLSGAIMWLSKLFLLYFLEAALQEDHFALLFVPIQRLSKVKNFRNFL